MFHMATAEDIVQGRISDVYFERTVQILKARGIDRQVVTEIRASSLPKDWPWAVFAGLEECLTLIEKLAIEVDIQALPEGTLFHAGEPVLSMRARYLDICIYETAILGFLCQASGIATTAARCRKAAGERPVISFGARRMHPAIAPMIDRSSFIGGATGVSVLASAELIGERSSGTMPHALILLLGDTVEAIRAFHAVIDPQVPRIALIDTFNDEKFEALRVVEALGKDLNAIRLDTPGSRRGNLAEIIDEIRWELQLRGLNQPQVFVSGGLDEQTILALNPYVDGYGVGTYLSNAPTINFSYDIVAIENRPLAKRGKKSGSKSLWACNRCHHHTTTPAERTPAYCANCASRNFRLLHQNWMKKGRQTQKLPTPQEIRRHLLEQLKRVTL